MPDMTIRQVIKAVHEATEIDLSTVAKDECPCGNCRKATQAKKYRSEGEPRCAGTKDYTRRMRRMIEGYAEAVEQGNASVEILAEMRDMQKMLNDAMGDVVRLVRTEEHGAKSWQQIADELGVTRAAAHNRWGGAETDARKAGGQPGDLR